MNTDEVYGEYATEAEIQEAMNLLHGEPAAIIEQPRSRLVIRDGLGEEWTTAWVKLSTAFKPHIKEIRGAPLAVWLYISLSINRSGTAFPSINKIAEDTGYSRNGVIESVKVLEQKGYLSVRRGERKFNLYEPKFAANGRGNDPDESTQLTDPDESTEWTGLLLPPDESTFSPNESTPVDLNKKNKREQEGFENSKKSPKRGDVIDAMLAYQNGEYWKGRETFLAEDLPLADFWHTATGQPLNGNKAQLKSLRKAVTAWRDQRLSVASLQAALDNRKAWKKGGLVSDPNEITADAAAIEAAGGLRTDESRGEYRPSRISA